MRRIFGYILLGWLSLSASTRLPGKATGIRFLDSLVCYLAGVEILKSAGLDAKTTAQQYRTLVTITGVDAKSAVSYLEAFRERPQALQSILNRVAELIESSVDTDHTTAGRDSVTGTAGRKQ